MTPNYNHRIFGLDIMRATAILFVVISHTLWLEPEASGFIPDVLRLAGVMGVEIFFVLSGFLIGRIMYRFFSREDFSFKAVSHFWIRRWFRTIPNYLLVLLINIGIAILIGVHLPDNLWSYFFFLQNLASEMPLFFVESWSLPIEEFAYIIGPTLLYFFFIIKLKGKKSRLFLLMTVLIILLFLLNKVVFNAVNVSEDMNYWNVNLKAVVIYRVDAIYYGVLAAFFSEQKPKLWNKWRHVFFSLGIFTFVLLNVIISKKQIYIEQYPFFWNVCYLPINSVAIALTLPLLSKIKTAPKLFLKPITYISLISYSMYLLHYSVILQLMKYYIPVEGWSGFDLLVYIMVYLSITILSSYALYSIFEKPMMDLRESSFIKKRFS
jgi:peptidoglycan/LPS O-acetylase OafA/YrhL